MKKGVFIFTIFYILCEIVYNLGLIEFLSNANTEISTYDRLEFFGKSLASLGFALFISRLFKRNKELILIVLLPIVFLSQTFIFNAIIDNLPRETALNSYVAGVYRNAVLNGTLNDERLTNKESYNQVLTSVIPALNTLEDNTEAVNSIFKVTPDSEVVEQLYLNYKNLNDRIEPYWVEYLRHSKRYDNYPAIAKKKIDLEFREKTGGLPQGLSKSEFYSEVSATSPSFREYQSFVIIPENRNLGIEEITGKDFPLGLTKDQFISKLQDILLEIDNATSINEGNLENLPYSRELIASVVIPPIAISLSLLAIFLNASALLYGVRKPLVILPGALLAFTFYTYDHNPYGLSEPLNKAIGVEATFHSLMGPVATLVKDVSIDENNPNELEVIRITKPEPIDFSDLEQSMSSLKNIDLPEELIDDTVTADVERLENDRLYHGELNKKGRINPYTGKPY